MTATLLLNARIHSPVLPAPQAMLIEDGRIAWLGTNEQAKSFTGVPVIDCQGKWLAPAFADAHVHVTNTGIELSSVSLKDASAAEDITASLRSHSRTDVIIGHGWDDTDWTRPPTLSDIASEVPTYISRVDVHSALINQRLIDRCPDIQNMDGWSESGVVSRAAHGLARTTAYGLLSEATKAAAREVFFKRAASLGIAAVDEMAGPIVSSIDDAAAVHRQGQMPDYPEVFVWWGELDGVQTAQFISAYGCGGDLFVDGSLGSKTALLRDSYCSGESGAEYITADQVVAHIDACIRANLPTGFHAIGDGALDSVLNGFAHAAEKHGVTAVVRGRHRIEHAEMLSDHHREIAGRLGIALSMQPQFDELWAGPGGMYEDRVGSRAAAMNDFAAAASQGVALLFGSDAPVTDLNPWRTLKAANAPHHSEHAISMRAAFAASTRGFWRNHGIEDCGTIEVGAWATLALWDVESFEEQRVDPTIKRWSTDPRSGNQPLPNIEAGYPECLMTWKRGELIFERTENS